MASWPAGRGRGKDCRGDGTVSSGQGQYVQGRISHLVEGFAELLLGPRCFFQAGVDCFEGDAGRVLELGHGQAGRVGIQRCRPGISQRKQAGRARGGGGRDVPPATWSRAAVSRSRILSTLPTAAASPGVRLRRVISLWRLWIPGTLSSMVSRGLSAVGGAGCCARGGLEGGVYRHGSTRRHFIGGPGSSKAWSSCSGRRAMARR